jgi:hypothetical protein
LYVGTDRTVDLDIFIREVSRPILNTAP